MNANNRPQPLFPAQMNLANLNHPPLNNQKQPVIVEIHSDDDDSDDDDRKQPAVVKIHSEEEEEDDDDDSVEFCGQKMGSQEEAHASFLKYAEGLAREDRKKQEEEAMASTIPGRSVLFVEKVIQLLQPSHKEVGIELLGKDDAVFLTEQFFNQQEQFKTSKTTPTQVSIGYHYTWNRNLDSIRSGGLLTIEDRIKANNSNKRNVAFFGNGIYTGTNPHAFSNYGEVGLLVATLKGKEHRVEEKPSKPTGYNTIIGNKTGSVPFHDEVILQQSSQVLPLAKFPVASIQDSKFSDVLWSIHQQLQHQILDEYFNGSERTVVQRILPPSYSLASGLGGTAFTTANFNALMQQFQQTSAQVDQLLQKAKKTLAQVIPPPKPTQSSARKPKASLKAAPNLKAPAVGPSVASASGKPKAAAKQQSQSSASPPTAALLSSGPKTRKRKIPHTQTTSSKQQNGGIQITAPPEHQGPRRSARLNKNNNGK